MSKRGARNRLKRALDDRLESRKPKLDFFHAYLGDGQGNVVIDEDEPNYVWARSQGRGIVYKVYNSRVPNLNNLPVIVGLDDATPYRWEVISVRRGDIDVLIDEGMQPGVADGVGPHHWQHEFRRDGTPSGSDVVWVNIQQVTDGLVHPSNPAGMTVEVYKCWYAFGSSFQFFPEETSADLSAYAPADAGTARWVLISIDADTNSLQYTNGTTFPTVLFPSDEAETIPDAPSGSVPLAAVYISDTTTTLTWANIYDMRLFPFGVSGTTTATSHRLLEAAVHSDVADNVVSTGDLIYGNGIYPEWDVLTLGSEGQYLRSDGTHPEWSDILNSDLPNPIAFECPPTEISIDVYGATTATQNTHILVGTYLGSDDLETINGLTDCQFLLLKAKAGHTIVLKHGTGNIHFDDESDFTLDGDTWLLMYYDGTLVCGIGPVSGGGGSVTWGDSADILDVDLSANDGGALAKAARADHKHDLDESIEPTWTGDHEFSARALFNLLALDDGGEVTMWGSGGTNSLDVTASRHTVDTEGDVAQQDLHNINGGEDGDLLLLSPASDSRTVTIQSASVNIDVEEDFAMTDTEHFILLYYDGNDSEWHEICRRGDVVSHASQHENGGDDEISVSGLSGVLADKQDADKLQGRDISTDAPADTEVLAWNAATSEWEPILQSSCEPGGADTEVQFNDGGAFGGDSGLAYDKATSELSVGGDLDVTGSITSSIAQGCRVCRSTTQAISSGSLTTITYDTEIQDNGGCWDSANGDRLVAPEDGYYMAGASFRWDGTHSGRYRCHIVRNSDSMNLVRDGKNNANTTDVTFHSLSTGMFYMSAGDYIQIKVHQNSGSSQDLDAATGTGLDVNLAWLIRVA